MKSYIARLCHVSRDYNMDSNYILRKHHSWWGMSESCITSLCHVSRGFNMDSSRIEKTWFFSWNLLESCITALCHKIRVITWIATIYGQLCFCWGVLEAKVGIRNLSPHLRNSAILRTTKSMRSCRLKNVAELGLRTFKI